MWADRWAHRAKGTVLRLSIIPSGGGEQGDYIAHFRMKGDYDVIEIQNVKYLKWQMCCFLSAGHYVKQTGIKHHKISHKYVHIFKKIYVFLDLKKYLHWKYHLSEHQIDAILYIFFHIIIHVVIEGKWKNNYCALIPRYINFTFKIMNKEKSKTGHIFIIILL